MNPAQVTEALDERRHPIGLASPHPDEPGPGEPGGTLGERPEGAAPLEVRRNGALAGVVGVLAAAVAIAWLGRATTANAALDWAVVVAMGLVAAGYLRAALDARTPLLIADAQGVRVRLGRSWRGLPWSDVAEVEHRPRRGLLRDGCLAIIPRDPVAFLEELGRGGRRQARLAQRLYGAPLGVPLGSSTRLVGDEDDLVAQLESLADPSVRVADLPAGRGEAADVDRADEHHRDGDGSDRDRGDQDRADQDRADQDRADQDRADQDRADDGTIDFESDPSEAEDREARRLRHPRLWLARAIGGLSHDRLGEADQYDPWAHDRTAEGSELEVDGDTDPDWGEQSREDPDAADPSDTDGTELADEVRIIGGALPAAGHAPRLDARLGPAPEPETGADPHRGPDGGPAADPGPWAGDPQTVTPTRWTDRVRPIARLGQPVEPLVVDDFRVEPAPDPVIGPDVAAARTRLGLTVDQLAERTRIRPHVIESIEVDDFAPCGGDFYARGHLRTLARVLGVDAAPLLARYDQRYAHAPVDARRVFEAELASAGARSRSSSRGRGGPNWSVLVAAFMAVVLCWSVAQLVLESPPDVRPPTPTLRDGSAGVGNSSVSDAEPVPVLVGAVQGGASIEVSDGNGEPVFSGDVAYGESRALRVVPPVQVSTDDGGAVEVTVAGEWQGRMGRLGEAATQSYATDR